MFPLPLWRIWREGCRRLKVLSGRYPDAEVRSVHTWGVTISTEPFCSAPLWIGCLIFLVSVLPHTESLSHLHFSCVPLFAGYPLLFFWHLCLFLRQSSRFLGWRRHWVVIEDGRVSWYHRQWANLHMLAKLFKQMFGLFTSASSDLTGSCQVLRLFPCVSRADAQAGVRKQGCQSLTHAYCMVGSRGVLEPFNH